MKIKYSCTGNYRGSLMCKNVKIPFHESPCKKCNREDLPPKYTIIKPSHWEPGAKSKPQFFPLVPGSHNSSILFILQKGKRFTTRDAVMSLGCYRLAARIFDLKQRGHEFEGSTPSKKHHKEYWMTPLQRYNSKAIEKGKL
jgi:hypothetical protein